MRALLTTLLSAVLASPAPGPGEIQGFDGLMRAARVALWKSDLDQARQLAKRALEESDDPPEGGPHRLKAKELLGDIALKDKKFKVASWHFRDAAHFALDDQRTRTRLIYRRKAALEKAEDAKGTDWVDQILKHDLRVSGFARAPAVGEKKRAEARAQIGEAIAAYRADKDMARAEWAQAVRALVSVRSGAREEGLEEARAIAASKKGSRTARMLALEASYGGLIAASDVDGAARAMLELNALRFEALPDPRRRYMRARGVDLICAKYEEAHGAGSCTRLEKEVTGRWSFTDFSQGKVRRELTSDDLDRAHRQFLPVIEDCVRTSAQANRDIFQGSDLQISWSIQPKGNVSDVDITPKRYREEIGPCVEERIAWFRYPRYTSPERKTVTVPYHLD
jgi:hypothetical protein